jgi:pseudouridine kinase
VIVVIGGANLDVRGRSTDALIAGTSNPGQITTSPGGVARNIAENLALLGNSVRLVAAVGRDRNGDDVLSATKAAGVDISLVRRTKETTGVYVALLDSDGELGMGISDMSATAALRKPDMKALASVVAKADLVVLDGNLKPGALGTALDVAADAGVPVVLDPASSAKAVVLGPLLSTRRPVFVLTPSGPELAALTGIRGDPAAAAARLHEDGVEHVWIHLGSHGSLLSGPKGVIELEHVPTTEVIDVTGAGDAMVAGFCHAHLKGESIKKAARFGLAAAALTVASTHTVVPDLDETRIRALL